MSNNFKCFNLTDTVLSIQLDNIDYTMLPKGTRNPETGQSDSCIMRPEHVEHPKVQVFLLATPPKVRIVPLKKIDSSEDMEKLLNQTMEESNTKIKAFKTNLDKLLSIESEKISEQLRSVLSRVNSEVGEIHDKIHEVVKQIDNLKREINNIEVPKTTQKVTKNSNSQKNAANLFGKGK